MTYAEQLEVHYSETRRRLYGKPRIRNVFGAPVPAPHDDEPCDDPPAPPTGQPFTWRAIVAEVEAEMGLSLDQMRGPNRKRPWTNARRTCWYRMRTEIDGASWSWIAQLFHRDKTTIVHGVGRYCIENNLEFPSGEQHGWKSKPSDADR